MISTLLFYCWNLTQCCCLQLSYISSAAPGQQGPLASAAAAAPIQILTCYSMCVCVCQYYIYCAHILWERVQTWSDATMRIEEGTLSISWALLVVLPPSTDVTSTSVDGGGSVMCCFLMKKRGRSLTARKQLSEQIHCEYHNFLKVIKPLIIISHGQNTFMEVRFV